MSIHDRKTRSGGALAVTFGAVAALTVAALAIAPAARSDEAAMTVTKDAATGQLRAPTAAEAQALEQERVRRANRRGDVAPGTENAAARAARTRHARNGGVGYRAGDKFLNLAVVTKNGDGSMTMHCVEGEEAAAKILAAPQAATGAIDNGAQHEEQLDVQ